MATYREAGVDLDAAEALVDRIKPAVTATWGDGVRGGFGGFAAGITLPAGYTRPVLMMSTDGVGTKAELARQTGVLDGLGYDLVAMCVDDLVAAGARPLAFTDYIATGRLDVDRVARLVESIAQACTDAGVALVGGETAEHPGVMDVDGFDLAGAALGVVEEGEDVTGDAIRPGDTVVGVRSPNLRSNGFSLVRRIIDRAGLDLDRELHGTGRRAAEVLLEPSVIYTPAMLEVIATSDVHGLAHVTGGGIAGNLQRVLPSGVDAVVDRTRWDPPPIFQALVELGHVDPDESFRAFNMGIGFVVVIDPDGVDAVVSTLEHHGHDARSIGEIVPGAGHVELR